MHDTDTEAPQTITLLLVDDHPVVRKGTRELLEGESDLKVLGEAGNGEEAIAQTRALNPKVILMDVSMPGMNGIEATRAIKAENPGVGVLVLTSYDDDAYVFALLEAGAAGYLLKNASEDDLLGAVRAVAAGESALHPSIARKVLERFSTVSTPTPPEDDLSSRELEVLRVAATGRTNKEIARDLGVSPDTVKDHLARLYAKLDARDRTEAVGRARTIGLLN